MALALPLFPKEDDMAQVTWLGEEDQTIEEAGEFKKGEAREVTDERMLAVYAKNRYFKVEGYKKPEPTDVDDELYPAPSTVSAQHPVAKPGEPVPKPPEPPATEPVAEAPLVEASPAEKKLKPVPKGLK